jgi:hypothetical protein
MVLSRVEGLTASSSLTVRSKTLSRVEGSWQAITKEKITTDRKLYKINFKNNGF